jgi:malonyl CoA-acyl carrier protein transacylase
LISQVLQSAQLTGIDIASFNGPSQTVISGPTNELVLATRALMDAGAQTVVPLTVSAPFHSRYMMETSLAFEDFLADVDFRHIRLRVVANVTGRPYPVTESSVVRSYLVKQINHPVQWTRSMRYLLSEGASSFREIGPGHALTGVGRSD